MRRFILCSLFLLAFFHPQPALAWDPPGHVLIAYIAYGDLKNSSPETLARAMKLLKLHPDYKIIRSKIRTTANENNFDLLLFVYAAQWGDDINTPNPEYRRRSVEDKCSSCRFFEFAFDPAKQPDQPSGILNSRDGAKDLLSSFAERWNDLTYGQNNRQRAVDLTWILTQIADVHQPVHVTSLVSPSFPTGDRNGFRFPIITSAKTMSVHSYWDGLLPKNLVDVPLKAKQLSKDFPLNTLIELNNDSPAHYPRTVIEEWANESFDIARKFVYKNGTLKPSERLSNNYQSSAKQAAEKRALLAGHRLANALKIALGRQSDPIDPSPVPRPDVVPKRPVSVETEQAEPPSLRDFDSLPEAEQKKVLFENGPLSASAFRDGNFSMRAFVKGGWRVMIEYGLEVDSTASVTFQLGELKIERPLTIPDRGPELRTFTVDNPGGESVTVTIGKGVAEFSIPPDWPQEPNVAKVNFLAQRNRPSQSAPYFRVYGLSAGTGFSKTGGARSIRVFNREAVLSHHIPGLQTIDYKSPTIIDRLLLDALSIKPAQGEKFNYKFHSREDLSKLSALFFLDYVAKDGSLSSRLIHLGPLGSIRRDKWSTPFNWDGRDAKRKVVSGSYQIQLRGWNGPVEAGSWVICSPDNSLIVNN